MGVPRVNEKHEVGNILRFGADPTGVRDCSAALQACAEEGLGVVFFPAGKFYFARPLTEILGHHDTHFP